MSSKRRNAKEPDLSSSRRHTKETDVSALRTNFMAQEFTNAIGRRALILTDNYPFLIIGAITDHVGHFVSINVETTHTAELEGRVMGIHLDHIHAFYIEDGEYSIPVIR